MAGASVVIDSQALANLIRGPQGPVMRSLIVAGEEVRTLAKAQVGYSTDPERNADQPHLRDTIVKRIVASGNGAAVIVGSTSPHALLHHEGTRPHEIRPVRARVLRFRSQGSVVFARVVHHPGTKPNRYLVDPLRQVIARRYGGRAA